jgi:hypothetical protein
MNEPLPNTSLAVETVHGTSHYGVTYLDHLCRDIAVVIILAGDWLDMGGEYDATLINDDVRNEGSFTTINCQTNGGRILFVGIWRAQ